MRDSADAPSTCPLSPLLQPEIVAFIAIFASCCAATRRILLLGSWQCSATGKRRGNAAGATGVRADIPEKMEKVVRMQNRRCLGLVLRVPVRCNPADSATGIVAMGTDQWKTRECSWGDGGRCGKPPSPATAAAPRQSPSCWRDFDVPSTRAAATQSGMTIAVVQAHPSPSARAARPRQFLSV